MNIQMEEIMSFIKKSITNGLHIIIVGCGKVGTTLVEQDRKSVV